MKFVLLPALCLIGNSFAAPIRIQARDLTVINYNLKRVQDSLTYLDSLVTRKPDNVNDPQQWVTYFQTLLQGGDLVMNELFAGATEIRAGPSVTDYEAISLMTPALASQAALNKVMTSLQGVKPQAYGVGAQNAIIDTLTRAQGGTVALIDAINSKVSTFAALVVSSYKTSFSSALQKGIDGYKRL